MQVDDYTIVISTCLGVWIDGIIFLSPLWPKNRWPVEMVECKRCGEPKPITHIVAHFAKTCRDWPKGMKEFSARRRFW